MSSSVNTLGDMGTRGSVSGNGTAESQRCVAGSCRNCQAVFLSNLPVFLCCISSRSYSGCFALLPVLVIPSAPHTPFHSTGCDWQHHQAWNPRLPASGWWVHRLSVQMPKKKKKKEIEDCLSLGEGERGRNLLGRQLEPQQRTPQPPSWSSWPGSKHMCTN